MNKHDILKLIKMRRGKCVGIAFNKHKIYYAVSGDDINPITNVIAKDIETVIGNQPTRCIIEDSFTMIAYWNEYITNFIAPFYKSIEDKIYNNLLLYHQTEFIFPDYLDSKILFKPYMRKTSYFHSMRNYSCVERKIIGKIKLNKIKIYVGMNPCYYCLPIIRNVEYLSRETKKLTVLIVSKYKNKFIYKTL